MLTPPNGCIQVALSINRATHCFDTSHSRSGTAESGVSGVLLADSKHKRQRCKGLTVTTGRAVLSIGEMSPLHQLPLSGHATLCYPPTKARTPGHADQAANTARRGPHRRTTWAYE